jgi:hypothetical protein
MSKERSHVPNPIIEFLSKDDHTAFSALSSQFRNFLHSRRHAGMAEFSAQLTALHTFICRSPTNQSLRAMACGIFFGRGFILVNTLRLKELLIRSKSGMNHCFQVLGYDVMRPSKDLQSLFQMLLPSLDEQAFQLRQWCLRIETDGSIATFMSHIPESIAASFEVGRIPARDPPVRDAAPEDIRWLLNREPPWVARGTVL